MNGPSGVPDLVPPRPPRRWRLRIAVSLVTVAALVWGSLEFYDYAFVRCADGVRERGPREECVGVSDGSYPFDDKRLGSLMDRIRRENERVGKSGDPWVALAYFEPMTLGTGDKGWKSIEEELQGAHLAQLELNDPAFGHGDAPQIKLLPANPGHGSRQWRPLVEQIAGMTDGDHPVVAVAGFGQSLGTTRAAVEWLRARDIPMVGSTVTADELSDPRERGFFRAVPPNADETSAVVKHLRARQRKEKDFTVQVVKDRNQEDIYSASLLDGFTRAARRAGLRLDSADFEFMSRMGGVSNALATLADRMCRQAELPDAVYFAGRGRDLRGFIESAAAGWRRCPVDIYTGDDAVGMFFDFPWENEPEELRRFRENWRASEITVRYTALAHPEAAPEMYPGEKNNAYENFRQHYARVFGGAGRLLNGQAMLGHDAVLVAGTAIRRAARPAGKGLVTAETVQQMLGQVSETDAVRGAAGPVDFDEAGNPEGKPLPLVELRPDDQDGYRYLRVLKP
ncbi:ABC transporter substrate-binding protein [Streptomyces sp. JJ36]|uniref:ABC transporter substrate-binding protein n=1 Tax=Streptomyces sp. JJ36 TaxID=2736645 RepID=UPI001F485DE5|nr:hypothetical protein [Streptomyces sp. JJ36]MCF6524918.1 ABC transporter substrate-binding protein [Streptomyces sp. JJ36]